MSSYLALNPRHSLLLIDTHTLGYFQRACSEKLLAGPPSRHHSFGVYFLNLLGFLIYCFFLLHEVSSSGQRASSDPFPESPSHSCLSHQGEGAARSLLPATCTDAVVSSLAYFLRQSKWLRGAPPAPGPWLGWCLPGTPPQRQQQQHMVQQGGSCDESRGSCRAPSIWRGRAPRAPD